MLSYPFGTKGYRLLDLKTSQVFVSRDVLFHEIIFPFQPTQSLPTLLILSAMPSSLPQSPTSTPQSPDIHPIVLPKSCLDFSFDSLPPSPQLASFPSPQPTPSTLIPSLRHSTRTHRPPTYLQNIIATLLPLLLALPPLWFQVLPLHIFLYLKCYLTLFYLHITNPLS
jgi:hypothetical protein